MKPGAFEYLRPKTIDEAIEAKEQCLDALFLAGGQSLIPAMNFRFANPGMLIDLGGIDELRGIIVTDRELQINAMTTHREVETNSKVLRSIPILGEALSYVAHIPIRNRGTLVGSIAHADAAAEIPAVLLACDGKIIAKGPRSTRQINASEFFVHHLTTSLEIDEVIIAVRFPILDDDFGYAFDEFARRKGDYSIAGVCALVAVDSEGQCTKARLSSCGVANTPVRMYEVENALIGRRMNGSNISAACASTNVYVTAAEDRNASTEYRKHLLKTLTKRAIYRALTRAQDIKNLPK